MPDSGLIKYGDAPVYNSQDPQVEYYYRDRYQGAYNPADAQTAAAGAADTSNSKARKQKKREEKEGRNEHTAAAPPSRITGKEDDTAEKRTIAALPTKGHRLTSVGPLQATPIPLMKRRERTNQFSLLLNSRSHIFSVLMLSLYLITEMRRKMLRKKSDDPECSRVKTSSAP